MSIQHIINNYDILTTECGQLVRYADPSVAGPFYTAGGEVAIWDDQPAHSECGNCRTAYLTKHAA